MAHYGTGRSAHNYKVSKDPNAAYTKAPVHWLGNVLEADGTEHFVMIRKGKGVKIARAFGLPFAPVMAPDSLRRHLSALSSYKPFEDAAADSVRTVKAAYKKLDETRDKLAEAIDSGKYEDGKKLSAERDEAAKYYDKAVDEHTRKWDEYLKARDAYNTAAEIFGLRMLKILEPSGVA